MMLTRRGWFVIGVVVFAILSGFGFGARALNAIAAPGIVALVAAVVQVVRTDPPTLVRTTPTTGRRGETIEVALEFESESPIDATVIDTVSDGLEADGNAVDATVGGDETTVRYTARLAVRGPQRIGPTRVIMRDVFGLASTEFRYTETDEILVLPRVYALQGPRRHDLLLLYGGPGDDHQEFDQLRLYQRGDPLRDIHWKSSAKRPADDLVVKQFTADDEEQAVEIAAEATRRRTDAMADAAASIAVHLLQAGVHVGIVTPTGRLDPDVGRDHRDRILAHLARTEGGRIANHDRETADVWIRGTGDATYIRIDDREFTFPEIAGATLDDISEESTSYFESQEPSFRIVDTATGTRTTTSSAETGTEVPST